jgi:hypothetical protein
MPSRVESSSALNKERGIVRPAWLNDRDEIDYETTRKGEPFKGSVVSRKSVADLVVKVAQSQRMAVCDSLGVSKP